MAELRVEVTDEFLTTLVKDPVTGLIELLDNALDADANNISVALNRDVLGKLETVVVTDNGTGMTHEEAGNLFRPLGKSQKLHSKVGPRGRARRGRRGRGRFAAYAIGERVVWETTTTTSAPGVDVPSSSTSVRITGSSRDIDRFDLADAYSSPGVARGTVVTISGVHPAAAKLENQATRSKLLETYAMFLARQKSLTIAVDGLPLTVTGVQTASYTPSIALETPVEAAPATVRVVEWSPKVLWARPALVLCDGSGDALLDLAVLPHAPVHYTAYVDWDGFAKNESTLPLAESDTGDVGIVVRGALTAVADWVASRSRQARSEVISAWKNEESYPYLNPPATALEQVEQEMFDLVATTAAPVLASGDPKSRRLSLRLIQEALRRDPSEVTEVLTQVLNLPAKDLADLNDLLRHTSLSNIVATARTVQHRLRVLDALDTLMAASKPVKGVLERPIHELVAAEPWLFGDEYALTLSEKGLTAVLAHHRNLLGSPVMLDDPNVKVDVDGHIARVDLLLTRTIEHASDSREHLVVELKRPGLPLNFEQTAQIQKYAFTIAADERFRDQSVRWDFLLIGSTIDDVAARQVDARTGVLHDQDNVRIRVTSWDTLIHGCRHRLKFVKQALDLAEQDPVAVSRLGQLHADTVAAVAFESTALS